MSNWTPKRFWKAATEVECEGGFTVTLDARAVKTPAKTALIVPTLHMAEAIAQEWGAQVEKVRPETMPCTRAANSALDKVAVQFDEVAAMIAAYGGSDLLCYRAEAPQALRVRQDAGWDPLLAWVAQDLQAPLSVTTGVMPIPQAAQSLQNLHAQVAACTPFELAALHDLVAISGSLVLGLAVIKDRLSVDDAWRLSRIDEYWNIELWGQDEDAAAHETLRQAGFSDAARFFTLCNGLCG